LGKAPRASATRRRTRLDDDGRALGRRGRGRSQRRRVDGSAVDDRPAPAEILGLGVVQPGPHLGPNSISSVDQTTAYTLAGLIAGGVLAKAGFFKALFIGILAFKTFVILAAVAVFEAISAVVSGDGMGQE
jgi:hypothetical protein